MAEKKHPDYSNGTADPIRIISAETARACKPDQPIFEIAMETAGSKCIIIRQLSNLILEGRKNYGSIRSIVCFKGKVFG